MTTYRYIVFDVIKTLKQQYSNAQISENHVLFWVTSVANRLVVLHLKKQIKNDNMAGGRFLSIFRDLPVITLPSSLPPDQVEGRKNIILPGPVMDLDREDGISYITYQLETGCCDGIPTFTTIPFSVTTPQDSVNLYRKALTTPSSTNPFYYRVGGRVYFLGIECVRVDKLEAGLFLYADPQMICDMDAEVVLPDHLIPILRTEVLNLGSYLLMKPQDRFNNGGNETQGQASAAAAQAPVSETQLANQDNNGE